MDIVYAPAHKQMTIPSDQASVISTFNDILPSVGWTRLASLKATCSFPYPLGYPLVDGTTITPKRVVKCPATPFLRIGDVAFNLYDPGKETPQGACNFVAMSTSVSTGLDNLVAAITAATAFNASWAVSGSGWIVNLEAKAAGPDWNLHQVVTDGRWGGFASNGGYTVGGGYTFESAAGASIYRVTITSDINLYGDLLFSFLLNSQIVQYRLASNGGPGQAPGASSEGNYIIIANDFGFVIFNYSDDGSYPYIARSLFCMAPQIPTDEGFTSVYAVLILGPRSFRFSTSWDRDAITTCLDGLPATYSTSGGYPRLLALRSTGVSLLTSAGKPIITGAYVMFGYNSSSGAWIVGKLWGCAAVSDILLDGAIIDGHPFTTISFQDGNGGKTRGSLMMFAPIPAQRSGTCDVTGNTVTGLTGDNFTGLNHLDPITISGHPYFVDAVINSSHLTLTVAISNLSNVVWTVP